MESYWLKMKEHDRLTTNWPKLTQIESKVKWIIKQFNIKQYQISNNFRHLKLKSIFKKKRKKKKKKEKEAKKEENRICHKNTKNESILILQENLGSSKGKDNKYNYCTRQFSSQNTKLDLSGRIINVICHHTMISPFFYLSLGCIPFMFVNFHWVMKFLAHGC